MSTWNNATLILEISLFDHSRAEYLYQYTSIAHRQSRMYAVNTDFVSPRDDPQTPWLTDAFPAIKEIILFQQCGVGNGYNSYLKSARGG